MNEVTARHLNLQIEHFKRLLAGARSDRDRLERALGDKTQHIAYLESVLWELRADVPKQDGDLFGEPIDALLREVS